MFSKVAILATVSLALSVAAAPHGDDANCNTNGNYCCNSVQDSKTESGAKLLHSLIGVAAQGVTGQFGATCTPITAAGVGGGASCTQQPVCCSGNNFNGLVVVGCTPINVSL